MDYLSALSLSLSLFKLQKSQSTPDVSSSFEPPAEFSPIEHEFEDPLAQVAKETKKQQPFTTCVDVRNSLEHLRQALEQDETCDQYLVFTSVPRKFCRFSYNAKTQVLVTISIRRQILEIFLQRWEVVTQGPVLARSSPC
ncbi:unnamed protein product [Penicillium salamii]|nr:unnamed protein product [Penicillium salamii]CAG8119047.1 unnamed protein product [Penicillium salamii]CAG8373329.1 unnamed protein product [Penicillium salamii]